MKSLETNILHRFMAPLLVLLLLFPSGLQLAHAFEGHEHIECTITDTHMHEQDTDCSLCDFHFQQFSYDVGGYEISIISIENYRVFSSEISEGKQIVTLYFYLRGPPHIS